MYGDRIRDGGRRMDRRKGKEGLSCMVFDAQDARWVSERRKMEVRKSIRGLEFISPPSFL